MKTRSKALAAVAAATAISFMTLSTAHAASAKIEISSESKPALRAWGKSIGKLLKKEMETPAYFDTAPKYGTVTYLVTVNRQGTVFSAKRIQASGYKQLDDSAAKTIAAMGVLPPMPAALTAEAAQVHIRMAYLPMKSSSFLRPNTRKAKTQTLDLAEEQSGLRITLLDAVPQPPQTAGR